MVHFIQSVAVLDRRADLADHVVPALDSRNVVRALREIGIEVTMLTADRLDAGALARLFSGAHDLTYVAGLAPGAFEASGIDINPMEFVPGPVLLRVADPLYFTKFSRLLSPFGSDVALAGKDAFLADYLDRAGQRRGTVAYAPGCFDPSDYPPERIRPLAERDIPFLFVGNVHDTAKIEAVVRANLPRRLEVLHVLAAALQTEPARPAWRLAEQIFMDLAPDLSPYRGQGRYLLELATRTAISRTRIALVRRLARHPGLIVTATPADALGLPDDARARVVGPLPIAAVVRLLFRCRASIAMQPHLALGAVSERVFMSMAAGALVLSPDTPAMRRHFIAGTHFLAHDRDLSDLDDALHAAIAAGPGAQTVADAGRAIAHRDFSHVPYTRRLLAALTGESGLAGPRADADMDRHGDPATTGGGSGRDGIGRAV